jgi:predicted nucleotidyltransferase
MIKLEQARVPSDYQSDLERAAQILKEAGCTEIFLFGSLAEGDLREGSDIDLAVRGCPPENYFRLWSRLSDALRHPVDLIDLDSTQPLAKYLRDEKNFTTMNEKIAAQIALAMEEIEQLFSGYADVLARALQGNPNLADKTVVASMLHAFYNDLENIFLAVAKRYDQQLPTGDQWHKELLWQMTLQTPKRTRIISAELAQTLEDYLKFRHFFRHVYLLRLDWSQMEKLVMSLSTIWAQTKTELNAFVQSIGNTGDDTTKQ